MSSAPPSSTHLCTVPFRAALHAVARAPTPPSSRANHNSALVEPDLPCHIFGPLPTPPTQFLSEQRCVLARAPASSIKGLLREAFWKVDPERTGLVSMEQFMQVCGVWKV